MPEIVQHPEFHVGDIVRFRYAYRTIEGRIIEDRGAIAIGGQHLYRVLVDREYVRRELELPADELEKVG